MKVVGVQCDLAWEDAEANRRALTPRIEEAAGLGAHLVVLPEMWPSGFSLNADLVAEPEGGPSETFLSETAQRLGTHLCGSIARSNPAWERPRNVCVLATPGGALHRYAKIHTFSYGGESARYDSGDSVGTFDVEGVRVTPLVCYDLRFPELFAAVAAHTDLFVIVANWPEPRAAHWRGLLTARAIETQAYVLGVNRVGKGGGLSYRGDSMLISPMGEVTSSAPAGESTLVGGEVDPQRVAAVREEFAFLADRRPDVYRRARNRGE